MNINTCSVSDLKKKAAELIKAGRYGQAAKLLYEQAQVPFYFDLEDDVREIRDRLREEEERRTGEELGNGCCDCCSATGLEGPCGVWCVGTMFTVMCCGGDVANSCCGVSCLSDCCTDCVHSGC